MRPEFLEISPQVTLSDKCVKIMNDDLNNLYKLPAKYRLY